MLHDYPAPPSPVSTTIDPSGEPKAEKTSAMTFRRPRKVRLRSNGICRYSVRGLMSCVAKILRRGITPSIAVTHDYPKPLSRLARIAI